MKVKKYVRNRKKSTSGIITDGDIRRAILKKIKLNDKVKKNIQSESYICLWQWVE